MANLNPISELSAVVLPPTGTHDEVVGLPYGIYESSDEFKSGAVDQVAFTYQMLGGNVLDIELRPSNVYAAYEAAVLEYSYLINSHQARNVLFSALGFATASFDSDGEITSGSDMSLKFPKYTFSGIRSFSSAYATEAGVGGNTTFYSASITTVAGQQDYDLQSAVENNEELSGTVGNKRIIIRRVFYRTPASMWRFFGWWGNVNVLANGSAYGQWSDGTTFEVVPVWHNKLQAMSYEDALRTRVSHYSYSVRNNKLKLFPIPSSISPEKFWFEFTIPSDPWTAEDGSTEPERDGINNINTLPFANIPYTSINSIGKQWIRRYAFALSKEVLAQIRGKLKTIPFANGEVTLNASELMSEAKEEQKSLKEELKELLDKLVTSEQLKQEAEMADALENTLKHVPAGIYMG